MGPFQMIVLDSATAFQLASGVKTRLARKYEREWLVPPQNLLPYP